MAKSQRNYICQSCGTVHRKWTGKCDGCNEWNTITEEVVEATVPKGMSAAKGRAIPLYKLEGENHEKIIRHQSKMAEFDRVTGGGLVPGSALLIGGDPGIGKSTLLLQIVCALATSGKRCAYFSGEEAVDQVRLRASRLGVTGASVDLASANNVRDIIATVESDANPYDLVVIDSIQTMYVDSVDSAPGTVTQVRTSAQELIRVAKRRSICLLIVGHVTKDGQIAGPRVLEHMVDTVLYFEGDRGHPFRILRTVKNRFGATDEIGVFEMAHEGLVEVTNPSEIFLSQRQENVPGSAVLAGLEGSRPVLVEVQALVAPSALPSPRRAVIGWDQNRLAMVLAVIETRCGIQFSGCDVFLNVAGGIRISEPAADAAVAAALISAQMQRPLPQDLIIFGEIGLSGEIRQVAQPDLRLKEAAKLGFKQALCPRALKTKNAKSPDLAIKRREIGSAGDIMLFFADHTERLAS
ncbi:MAG: DNA repair protein RadA [Alphaproteobacteria bacterium]|nr:DNA repair protein RadA [Alphaproteobacteria bacterium]|tara:strand:- start:1018 stop:2415 length:1398 start_codon:yes stop_codon:yes gene_type:complete